MANKVDFKGYSTEDLVKKLEEEKAMLKKLKFTNVVSSLENPMKIRAARKHIARIKTEIRKRELNQEAS